MCVCVCVCVSVCVCVCVCDIPISSSPPSPSLICIFVKKLLIRTYNLYLVFFFSILFFKGFCVRSKMCSNQDILTKAVCYRYTLWDEYFRTTSFSSQILPTS